jgi:Holliday junction resolvase-like predicted endonuclease
VTDVMLDGMEYAEDDVSDLNSCELGCLSEIRAVHWLLRRGFHVFRNYGPSGPVDIIAMDPTTGHVIRVDVKTYKFNGIELIGGALSQGQIAMGVRLLAVTNDWVGWLEDHPSGLATRRPDGSYMIRAVGQKARPLKGHPWRQNSDIKRKAEAKKKAILKTYPKWQDKPKKRFGKT